MRSCEEFEIAIEMKRHGALAPSDDAALEGHLFTCASCREFRRSTEDAQSVLRTHAQLELKHVQWERLLRTFQRRLVITRYLPWAMGALLVMLNAWAALVFVPPLERGPLQFLAAPLFVVVLSASLISFVVGVYMSRRTLHEARAAVRTEQAFLDHLRQELDERISRLWHARIAVPLGLLLLSAALGRRAAFVWEVLLAVPIVIVLATLLLRRFRRERQALG